MQEKRSRKEQRRDRQQHYEELESRHDAKALERFKRPAYQSVSVAEYLAKKYDITAEVDKGILIEYADMKEEIKDLHWRIEKTQKELDKLHGQIVVDSVSCGKKGKKPLGTVKITGRPVGVISRKEQLLKKRNRRLEELEEELLEMTIQVEEYIESIEKSELRIIFRLYFLDDLSYPKVADQMNKMFPKRRIRYTDENIKKKIQRYFENVPQCPDKK